MKIYGVVPAAGKGSRLAPLPFSKELFPLGYRMINEQYRPRPVSLHLLEAFKEAGIEEVFWIIADHKQDIQKFYKSGTDLDMNFCYLVQEEPLGMVDAFTYVNPWLAGDDYLICVGMPDTLFYPTDIFKQMKQRFITEDGPDIILGVFETTQWHKLGMVELTDGKVKRVLEKPKVKPDTNLAWGCAMWRPTFQNLLAPLMEQNKDHPEYPLSDAFNEALRAGLKIETVQGESFTDTGTVDDLQKAIEQMNKWPGKDQDGD